MNARRVSKDQWLSVALEELEKGGIAAVRIEKLAKSLAISKSGFYWHFKDSRDLHAHMLDYWNKEFTQVVISSRAVLTGPPSEHLKQISKMIQLHDLGKFDLAFRAWAKHDELAAKAVCQVTEQRLEFVKSLFSAIGFRGDQLEMRSMLFVCYYTWESATFAKFSPRRRNRLDNLRLNLLTSK